VKDSSNQKLNSAKACEALRTRIRESVAKSAQLTEKIEELQAQHAELLRIQKELKQETRKSRAELRQHSYRRNRRLKALLRGTTTN
jgi:predicted RNase H-like nuclease (RuvC/YqgF family)